jgi:hypothetical protein
MLGTTLAISLLVPPGSLARVARAQEAAPAEKRDADLPTSKAEIARLKEIIAESAAMSAVDYHAQNLFFAGKAENWPLADYYWTKTLQHMRLSASLTPVFKDKAGQDVKLNEILQSIESTPSMQVGKAIESKDLKTFLTSYRSLLNGCYACHRAVDKPFLRPRLPAPPANSIITIDPKATEPR